MKLIQHTKACLAKWARSDDGAALVEFTLMLPIMILLFAVIIEGGRMFWSYQAAVSGVRDAARYLARVAPGDICSAGGSVAGYTSDLETIVRTGASGYSIFPTGLTITAVTPSLSCTTGSYRVSPAPVVEVTANLTITFPFANVFAFNGTARPTINTVISDQSKVFGT